LSSFSIREATQSCAAAAAAAAGGVGNHKYKSLIYFFIYPFRGGWQ